VDVKRGRVEGASTVHFLQYLDTFQKETEKLTEETEKLLNKYSLKKQNKTFSSPLKRPESAFQRHPPPSEEFCVEDIEKNMERLNQFTRELNKLSGDSFQDSIDPSLDYSP
jgi:hypothetical protein